MNQPSLPLDLGRRLALAAALTLAMFASWPRTAHADEVQVGSGRSASERRPVGEFLAIAVSGGITTRINQGTQAAAQVQADDNLLDLLETVVETRAGTPTLQVRWKKDAQLRSRVTPSVDVTVVRLQSVATNGSGNVVIDALATPGLKLTVGGSGDIQAKALRSDELEVAIAGSGRIVAAGRSPRLSVKVSGSGDVDTLALLADEVGVTIAGSGDVGVHAERSLSVSIAGSGDIRYRGNAALTRKVAGSGKVRKL